MPVNKTTQSPTSGTRSGREPGMHDLARTALTMLGFLVASLLVSSQPARAETVVIAWTQQLGTGSHDEGYSVSVDGSGNAYVTGYTRGGLDGNTNQGNYDLFLTKYNTNGAKQWTEQLGTSSVDFAYGVSVDGSGNAYVTGYTDGGLDGNTNQGDSDMFLIKFSPIPEPSSVLLAVLGVVGLIGWRRRRWGLEACGVGLAPRA